jgi:polyhydroxyalkanoate synthesis repressor PhaR
MADDDGAASPRLIKKYSNRKLYDTRSRRYVTLERIGELLRDGEDVRVVDRTSGEDLTNLTLSQILLETERRYGGTVPERVLQQLVKGPQDFVRGAVRSSINAGADLLQKAEQRVVRPPEQAFEEAMERTLRRLNIPTQRDLERFDRRLRDLGARVEDLARKLDGSGASHGGKPKPRKR